MTLVNMQWSRLVLLNAGFKMLEEGCLKISEFLDADKRSSNNCLIIRRFLIVFFLFRFVCFLIISPIRNKLIRLKIRRSKMFKVITIMGRLLFKLSSLQIGIDAENTKWPNLNSSVDRENPIRLRFCECSGLSKIL